MAVIVLIFGIIVICSFMAAIIPSGIPVARAKNKATIPSSRVAGNNVLNSSHTLFLEISGATKSHRAHTGVFFVKGHVLLR